MKIGSILLALIALLACGQEEQQVANQIPELEQKPQTEVSERNINLSTDDVNPNEDVSQVSEKSPSDNQKPKSSQLGEESEPRSKSSAGELSLPPPRELSDEERSFLEVAPDPNNHKLTPSLIQGRGIDLNTRTAVGDCVQRSSKHIDRDILDNGVFYTVSPVTSSAQLYGLLGYKEVTFNFPWSYRIDQLDSDDYFGIYFSIVQPGFVESSLFHIKGEYADLPANRFEEVCGDLFVSGSLFGKTRQVLLIYKMEDSVDRLDLVSQLMQMQIYGANLDRDSFEEKLLQYSKKIKKHLSAATLVSRSVLDSHSKEVLANDDYFGFQNWLNNFNQSEDKFIGFKTSFYNGFDSSDSGSFVSK